ncbi:MAG: flagellar biosynthetic protein FliO [Bdellovibrionales bacterium]
MDATELPQILKLIAALVFVLSLMGGLAFVLKKLGLSGPVTPQSKDKRLKIIEVLPLDAKRRLVLVQRDCVQHLIILGGNDERVVETGIAPPDNKCDERDS